MDRDTIAGLIGLAVGALLIWNRDELAYAFNWQNERLFGTKGSRKLMGLLVLATGIGFVIIATAMLLGFGQSKPPARLP